MQTRRLHHALPFGAALMLLLSSCQRDQTARVETDAHQRAVVTTPAPDSSDSTAAAPIAPKVTWHQLKRRTNAQAPLVRYRPVRRPAERDTAAPPPSEAHLLDLTLKASEYFRIDPTQAAEVQGREGTLIRIPALSLIDSRKQPVKEPVWVELKECYSVMDLLLSGCVSMNEAGEPLRSNGMVLVRASTARGQQLGLAEGSAVELEVPVEQRHPGLQLYQGAGRRPGRWAAAPAPSPQLPLQDAHTTALASAESTAVNSAESAADPIPQQKTAELPGSVFRSGKLGWLTCLRPWRPAAHTTSLTIAADEVDSHTTIRLVFPEAAVILEGESQPEGYTFSQVPAQQRAVLVGLRYFNGNHYVALREVVPGTDAVAPLEFRETTLSEMEQLLEKLM